MPEQAVQDAVEAGGATPELDEVADGAQGERETASAPPAQLPQLVEALLFVADGPVTEPALARALGVTRRALGAALEALADALRDRGLRLVRGPEGTQLVTAPLAAAAVEQFLGVEAGRRLSTPALETLAIVAYRQPVTRAVVEAVRGVNSDAAIDTLRVRGLIDVVGRAEGPGRPALFATTQRFLEHFGLERAADLPALPPELAERMATTAEGVQLALAAEEAWERTPGPGGWRGDAERDDEPARTPAGGPPALSFARGPQLPGGRAGSDLPRAPGGAPPGGGPPRLL